MTCKFCEAMKVNRQCDEIDQSPNELAYGKYTSEYTVEIVNCSEFPNNSDMISRQAAIDELDKGAWGVEWDKTLAKTMIESLPSAQPEPHEGHWIDKGWNGDWAWQIDGRGNCWRVIECSECGKSVLAESNYCPNCGAKMEVEHEA